MTTLKSELFHNINFFQPNITVIPHKTSETKSLKKKQWFYLQPILAIILGFSDV